MRRLALEEAPKFFVHKPQIFVCLRGLMNSMGELFSFFSPLFAVAQTSTAKQFLLGKF
jgi:hypothetical protein